MVLVGPYSNTADNPVVGEFRSWAEPLAAKAEAKRLKRQGRKRARRLGRKLGIDRDTADQQFRIGYARGVTEQQLDEARMTTEFREHREMVLKMMAERAERDRLAWLS